MINEYVIKLIENLPEELKNSKTPLRLDIVLDGGIFNGSYLVGALYFLKEMEKRKYVIIERISGCSIGSVVAFLYFMDALDEMPKLYDIVKNEFKNDHKLHTVKELKKHLHDKIPDNICEKVNERLYICYNNIKKGSKTTKSQYKDVDEIAKNNPSMFICVGMQMMAKNSDEGNLPGLSWIDAKVKKFDVSTIQSATRLPHMGWNDVKSIGNNQLFKNLETNAKFYFLHSYYFFCNNEEDVIGESEYGINYTSAANFKNIYGVQFHPEKSHNFGVQLLANFSTI